MSNIAKSTFLLMLATMLAKILGFAREITLMYTYGTSAYSDVYITSMNIPLALFSSIGAALVTTFIPIYHESLQDGGEKNAYKFTNNILNIVLILSIILSIIGYVFAEPLVKLFAMKFEGEKLLLTVQFVRIMMPGILFIGMSNIMVSYLQIKDSFTIPGLIALPNNIVIIVSIIISYITKNLYILAIGSLIGMISQFIFLIPFAIKKGYKFKLIFNLRDKYLKKMIFLVGPVFIGVAVNQINVMVDRSLASSFGDGIISALNSANRLNLFVTGLFISTIGAVIYPTLSKLSTNNNREEFSEAIVKSLNSIILLILPITIGAIVLATPIVKVLFERGAFDDRSTQLTSTALIFYSIGMIGFGLRDILSKVFYSIKDTKTPMINGIIAMILNVILNFILVRVMGYAGLALATSLSAIICTIFLFMSLHKKIGYFGQDRILKTTFKSMISTIIMGLVTLKLYNFLFDNIGGGSLETIVSLVCSVIIGVIIYGLLIFLLKVEEVNLIIDIVKKRLKQRNGA
ncbi:murein biosynthesis integral membrane protein MurJ [Paraclostridium bifermentans]